MGSRLTPSSFPSSVSHSLSKTKLRSSQRLQLMRMQAETEAKGVAVTMPIQTEALTADGIFSGSFLLRRTAAPSPRLSGSRLPSLSERAATAIVQSHITVDDDDDYFLRDTDGTDGFSSHDSSFTIPSVATSCLADFPNDFEDVLMEDDGGQISSSCPVIPLYPDDPILPYRGGRKKEPPPVFLTEESKILWLKERQKKDQHNNIEKRRRSKINDSIHELGTLLPDSYDIDLQNKKGNILEASVNYIRKLQNDEKRISQMKKQQDELERQNRKLQLQIQLLQMTMNTSQVDQSQPDPTIPDRVQTSSVLDLDLGPLPVDVHELDLLHDDLDMMPDVFDLTQLDPIFAGLHVETPTSSLSAAATGVPQIPVTVDDFMEFTM